MNAMTHTCGEDDMSRNSPAPVPR